MLLKIVTARLYISMLKHILLNYSKRMNSTKSLLLLALVGYTVVSGAVIKKNLAQADCPILSGQAISGGSSSLVSTAASAAVSTSSGSTVIGDLECSKSADTTDTSSEVGQEAAVGCESAKKLYLFGGAFDYYDTVATSEIGSSASLATATGVETATASSSLTSGSSGALPGGVCVSTCSGASYPVAAV